MDVLHDDRDGHPDNLNGTYSMVEMKPVLYRSVLESTLYIWLQPQRGNRAPTPQKQVPPFS